jgi:hypothetical protein
MGYGRKVVSLEPRHRCCRGRWPIHPKRAMPLYSALAQLQQHPRRELLITRAFLLIDANGVAAEKVTLLFGVPAFWEGDE